MRTSTWAIPIVVALALSAGACAGGDVPLAPRSSAPDARTAPQLAGTDAEFAGLAGEVPGFAGYWRDRDGRLTIALTDVSQRDRATGVLARRLQRDDRGPAGAANVRVVHADYDFAQLAAWHARVAAVLGIRGVVFTDADETANRIRIGISDVSAEAAVRAEVARLGIPAAAIIVERAAPVEPTAALSAYTRPVIGGLAITRSDNLYCTLGFNAYYVNPYWGAGAGTRVFFTADHCTATEGTLDGMVFSQGGSRIGVELADPPLLTDATSLSCPTMRRCRYSDAAAVRYDDGVSWSLGTLAHTQYWFSQSDGSLDTDPANPFHITSLSSAPHVGEIVGKVGATTGWTAGPVQKTCTNQPGSNGILLLCQDFVDAEANGGDSGAPAFANTWSGTTLYGIVWAKTFRFDTDTGTTVKQFVFSNISGLQRDFGYFTVT